MFFTPNYPLSKPLTMEEERLDPNSDGDISPLRLRRLLDTVGFLKNESMMAGFSQVDSIVAWLYLRMQTAGAAAAVEVNNILGT